MAPISIKPTKAMKLPTISDLFSKNLIILRSTNASIEARKNANGK